MSEESKEFETISTKTHCPDHHQFSKHLTSINFKLDNILEQLGIGNTKFALTERRLGLLEKLVYGCVGTMLLAMIGAFIALVIHK